MAEDPQAGVWIWRTGATWASFGTDVEPRFKAVDGSSTSAAVTCLPRLRSAVVDRGTSLALALSVAAALEERGPAPVFAAA